MSPATRHSPRASLQSPAKRCLKMASSSSTTQSMCLNEDDIDNDMLIEEVEARALIYDKTLKEYSDSNFKCKAWEEISAKVFFNVWGNLSAKEKTEAGKILQKRWKNIRACFSRELREQKNTKSGQAAKKRSKYKYFEKLLFLIPSTETRETEGNLSAFNENEDNDNSDEENVRSRFTVCDHTNRSQFSRKKGDNKRSYEDRLIDVLEQKKNSEDKLLAAIEGNKNEHDSDTHFALSLVPLLRSVPDKDKLNVRIQILQFFNNVLNQTKQLQTTQYTPLPPERQSLRPAFRQASTSHYYPENSNPQNYPQVYSKPNTFAQQLLLSSSPLHQHRDIRRPSSQCSTSLPPESPQNPTYIYLSSPEVGSNSSSQNASYANIISPQNSENAQSYVSNFSVECGDSEEIYDICKE